MSNPISVPSAMLLIQSGDGLTMGEIIDSLPTDPASLVVLALVLGFVGVIAYFGLRSGESGSSADPEEDEEGPDPGRSG
jgi:hypothetical protein